MGGEATRPALPAPDGSGPLLQRDPRGDSRSARDGRLSGRSVAAVGRVEQRVEELVRPRVPAERGGALDGGADVAYEPTEVVAVLGVLPEISGSEPPRSLQVSSRLEHAGQALELRGDPRHGAMEGGSHTSSYRTGRPAH